MATYPLLLLFAAVAVAVAAASSAGDKPTAYEMLERYDFPRGILPEGVEGYELDPDGGFQVYFPRECEFLLAKQWLVKYDTRIAGAASAGKLAALQGIYVKVLFLWIPVAEVDRAGDRLSFYIGPVSTSFPLSDFASSPHCRGYHDRAAVAAAVS
ncbi:hypothetical protein CFC21_006544 [Triticum aestivum]|uniref:DUF538 domain-containing protein n=2 Tax=Triticum aestivum TaxID=4565 RepID=A0A3B5YWC5_WHEAT|nr:uncharacterized protein At5g01610-like [Triticum dicoccoides]XP_044368457.1 uncharacterized protein At5g01610-like [Triticum aestivum]KAF6989182.1 hypothetical protein CFC21_006544 [Triticum aestivum]